MSQRDLARRGLLRGLATLPLIGGSVALIGNPTAAAEPVTHKLLRQYEAWLDLEKSYCRAEQHGRDLPDHAHPVDWHVVWRHRKTRQIVDYAHVDCGVLGWHYHADAPSSRAAIVLSAVGMDWREGSI